jgi:hypothetical protein
MITNISWSANVIGSSRPWKILAFDTLDEGGLPREFIVKHFRSDQKIARIVEYVAGRFAYETNIHAIMPQTVRFSPAFLEDLRWLPEPPRDVHLAEPGVHVAFAWNPRAISLMENHRALQQLEEPGQVGEIVGVDTVLINIDRSAENVLFEPRADFRGAPTHLLVPIDWELCFAGGTISEEFLSTPRLLKNARPWPPQPSDPMCNNIRSVDDFLSAITKLGGWTGARARLQMLVQGVPPEWEVSKQLREAILAYLVRRIKTTVARLQLTDDPDNVFPNWQNSLSLDSNL